MDQTVKRDGRTLDVHDSVNGPLKLAHLVLFPAVLPERAERKGDITHFYLSAPGDIKKKPNCWKQAAYCKRSNCPDPELHIN